MELDWLRTVFAFKNGLPSHDTLGRGLDRLDTVEFHAAMQSWRETGDSPRVFSKARTPHRPRNVPPSMVGCLAVKSVGGDLRDPPGCLFFPVVWASEPARSGDETTWFLTQKPSRPTPQPLTDFNIRLKRPPPNRLAPLRLRGFGWVRRGGGTAYRISVHEDRTADGR